MKKIILTILLVFVAFLLSVGIQFLINMNVEAVPSRPAESFDSGGGDRLLYYFYKQNKGEALPEGIELSDAFIRSELEGTFRYINGRYDVADFRVNQLVRFYLTFGDQLNPDIQEDIKEVLLGFKYWMDQGGIDGMCYWSENHQILFAVSEYLVGQTFPDDIFSVDGKTGSEHQAMAENRINSWMRQRFLYGFTEWYSNNYYPEDIAPMSNFIQFADDPDMVLRMSMIMDLLWYDMASQSFRYEGVDTGGSPRTYYVFVSSSGRMYSDNRASDDTGNRMRHFIDYAIQKEETKDFDSSWYTYANGFFNSFRQMMEPLNHEGDPFYVLPDIIPAIFNDSAPEKIIRSSQSLDVEELEGEGLLGTEDHQIMMQWNMEAFTNPAVIDNTIKYIAMHDMFHNEFLNDFTLVNLWPLRAFNLLDSVSQILRPVTDGVAIERANVYTYKTAHFSMHTAQAHQPGEYADQQAVSQINLANDLSIFTTQPAKIPRRTGTPTYWTGNGRQGYLVQEKNVQLAIYEPPTKPGFMEPMILEDTTHMFFPLGLFDEVDTTYLAQGYVFGRKGMAMIAVKARHALTYVPFEVSDQEGDRDEMLGRSHVRAVLDEAYDLVQEGPGLHYFVTELSDITEETFEAFKTRFMANALSFDENERTLTYTTTLYQELQNTTLEAVYAESFSINGTQVDLNYHRFEGPYVSNGQIERKPETITLEFQGHTLTLDYDLKTREHD